MPRFVILEHQPGAASTRPLHWDLMLEQRQVLKTWALPEPPAIGAEMTAPELPDHRLLYLDYNGPLSAGRGSVEQWDAGQYEWTLQTPDKLAIVLDGKRTVCRVSFERDVAAPQCWELRFAD